MNTHSEIWLTAIYCHINKNALRDVVVVFFPHFVMSILVKYYIFFLFIYFLISAERVIVLSAIGAGDIMPNGLFVWDSWFALHKKKFASFPSSSTAKNKYSFIAASSAHVMHMVSIWFYTLAVMHFLDTHLMECMYVFAQLNGVKKVSVPPPFGSLKINFTSFFFFFFWTQSCFSWISCPFLDAIYIVSFWCVDTGCDGFVGVGLHAIRDSVTRRFATCNDLNFYWINEADN